MKQADIYVHASRFEGKSIAIQEAQILGKPMVVSDCSGNREQVCHGKDGLMCGLTPDSLAENIMLLLEDEALRIVARPCLVCRHIAHKRQGKD